MDKLGADGLVLECLPIHVRLDEMRENSNRVRKIGTTKRGIGPAYEDKIGRRALRLIDLADPDTLDDKVSAMLDHHNALRRGYGREELDHWKNILTEALVQDPSPAEFPVAPSVSAHLQLPIHAYLLRRVYQ